MSNLNLMLFGVYPYMALAVLVIGSWARFDLSQYTWRAGSSQLMDDKHLRLASNLFHIGIIAVLAGHFVGLLTPSVVYARWLSNENKQLMAMLIGGFFGLICLVGLVMLLHRRLTNPRVRAQSSKSDIMVLWVLLIQLLLGLFTIYVSTAHLDGSQMVLLANWAQQIVTFQPLMAAASIEPVGLAYKLHVFLGITLFVLFPFTRLVHVISVPVWYLGRRYQIVRLKATSAASAVPPRPARPSGVAVAPRPDERKPVHTGGEPAATSHGLASPRPAAANKERS